ncbi:hypothetical protein G7046_g6019 [Stylonectria norvegica]|nr:hypothetical protein G7046_g6019 [Stylonectria norvegica]
MNTTNKQLWINTISLYPTTRRRMGDVIAVKVGSGSHTRTFHLNKAQTTRASAHIAHLVADGTSLSSPSPVAITDQDPDVFALFALWLTSLAASPPTTEANPYLQEPWLSRTAEAWVLAKRLAAPSFAKFCLKRFIENCALAPFGPWAYIEAVAEKGSALRRFSDHWVAWNANLLTGENHEFVELEAASNASRVDEYTGDPRYFDYEHWYVPCGDDISPRCDHNFKVREERALGQDESQGQAVAASLHDVGQSFELQPPRPSRHRSSSRSVVATPARSPSHRSAVTTRDSFSDHMKCWRMLSILTQISIFSAILGLIVMLVRRDDEGIKSATRTFSIFSFGVGILCIMLPWGVPLYWVFAVADGIALAIDVPACDARAVTETCRTIRALTVLVWLSIPLSALHARLWVWC